MEKSSAGFDHLCLLILTCFALAGCSSGPDRHAMEEARRSVPPMAADDTFFAGKIAAHLTLGSGLPDNAQAGGKDGSGSGGKGPGGAGGHAHGGRRGGGDQGSSGGSDASDDPRSHLTDSPMPPALLRLRLDNMSAVSLVVEIRDLNSELGDFAVRPDTFTLAPGASGEPDGMQSLLGLDTLALPVTITLRADGKTETKILTLRPVTPPVETPPPATDQK